MQNVVPVRSKEFRWAEITGVVVDACVNDHMIFQVCWRVQSLIAFRTECRRRFQMHFPVMHS